jgi:hypothetical protein
MYIFAIMLLRHADTVDTVHQVQENVESMDGLVQEYDRMIQCDLLLFTVRYEFIRNSLLIVTS